MDKINFLGDILFADPKFFVAKSCVLLEATHLWNKSHGEHHFLNGEHPKNLFFMAKIIFLGDFLFADPNVFRPKVAYY